MGSELVVHCYENVWYGMEHHNRFICADVVHKSCQSLENNLLLTNHKNIIHIRLTHRTMID